MEYRHPSRRESPRLSLLALPIVNTHPDISPPILSDRVCNSQVIKSRLQSAPNGTYTGFTDCVRKTIKADGVGALWKGFSAAMARAIPANVSVVICGR